MDVFNIWFGSGREALKVVLSDVMRGIKNSHVQGQELMRRLLKKNLNDIIGGWFSESWYIKKLKESAILGQDSSLLGIDKKDIKRRSYIAREMAVKKSLREEFKEYIIDLLAILESDGPVPEKELKEIGIQLGNMSKRIKNTYPKDFMWLAYRVIFSIDFNSAKKLEIYWSDIAGWNS